MNNVTPERTQVQQKTPTPWYAHQSEGAPTFWEITAANSCYSQSIATLCGRDNAGADAQFIVLAVNAHAQLVEALEEIRQSNNFKFIYERAEKALAGVK